MTRFDQLLWSIAQIVRETEFGEILRLARRAPEAGGGLAELKGWTIPAELQMWELSFNPAVQRTVSALMALDMLGKPVPAEAQGWIQWITQAHEAVQRIAANCWSGVSPDVRKGFLDYDDLLPPAMRGEIADLRRSKRGQNALKFAGLEAPRVQAALGRLFAEVRVSRSAVGAREAATTLERSKLRGAMAEVRARLEPEVRTIYNGETGGQGMERARQTVAAAYHDHPEVATLVSTLRSHNRYVTRIIWTLLGAAEQMQPTVLTRTAGPITDRIVDGERHVALTASGTSMALVRLTHPIWLELGSPLDGLYVVEGFTALLGPDEADLELARLV